MQMQNKTKQNKTKQTFIHDMHTISIRNNNQSQHKEQCQSTSLFLMSSFYIFNLLANDHLALSLFFLIFSLVSFSSSLWFTINIFIFLDYFCGERLLRTTITITYQPTTTTMTTTTIATTSFSSQNKQYCFVFLNVSPTPPRHQQQPTTTIN